MRSISEHILLWPSDVKVKCKGYCLCLGSAASFYSLGEKKKELRSGWDLFASNLNSLQVFISFKDQNNKTHTATAPEQRKQLPFFEENVVILFREELMKPAVLEEKWSFSHACFIKHTQYGS